jgi:polysaccharide pyruvyl transferase WcaK-like protein
VKILVFNVKYSPNLGDGVLAECLERTLTEYGADITVETIDLAGRHAYGAAAGGGRARALAALGLLPAGVRRMLVELAIGRSLQSLRDQWQARIAAADAVVIGGGNLFQDDDLNFPLKIAAVLDGVHRAGRPLAVFAVGVTRQWSVRAARLFGRLLVNKVLLVSVRDDAARENWIAHFGGGHNVEICPDPGLLARDMLPEGRLRPASGNPLVGLCVTHPLVLRRHRSIASKDIPLMSVAEYRQLVEWLVSSGCRVMLFSNGAREDQDFLDDILRDRTCAAHLAKGVLMAAARPRTPENLVEILRQPDTVAAHRLHASVIAYSLGTPAIGLGWDGKVESFFKLTNREDFFLQGRGVTAQQTGTLILKAMDQGIDPGAHGKRIEEARLSVFHLARTLRDVIYREDSRRSA